jgi:hypothetical protein
LRRSRQKPGGIRAPNNSLAFKLRLKNRSARGRPLTDLDAIIVSENAIDGEEVENIGDLHAAKCESCGHKMSCNCWDGRIGQDPSSIAMRASLSAAGYVGRLPSLSIGRFLFDIYVNR